MTAYERRAEMGEAVVVRPSRRDRIAGFRVLLVDDVMTSGATAGSCARALLAGGAARVDVLAAARVPIRASRDEGRRNLPAPAQLVGHAHEPERV